MLVSAIIEAARAYATISDSAFFTATDELRSVNRAYRDVYEKLCDCDDDYFLTEVTILKSAMTLVRAGVYKYVLPDDFHRIRNVIAPSGDIEIALQRCDIHESRSGYRMQGAYMFIYHGSDFDSVRYQYYPIPVAITATATDIKYPPQLEPLIIAYQVAIDIGSMQKENTDRFRIEYQLLWDRFEKASKRRDNHSYPRIGNVYQSSSWGW